MVLNLFKLLYFQAHQLASKHLDSTEVSKMYIGQAQELEEQGYTIVKAVLSATDIHRAQPLFDQLLRPSSGVPVATSNPGEGGRRQLNAWGPNSGGIRAELVKFAEYPSVLRSAAAVMMGDGEMASVRLMQTPIPCVTFPEAGQSWLVSSSDNRTVCGSQHHSWRGVRWNTQQ